MTARDYDTARRLLAECLDRVYDGPALVAGEALADEIERFLGRVGEPDTTAPVLALDRQRQRAVRPAEA